MITRFLLLLTSFLGLLGHAAAAETKPSDLLPLDSRWEYPHFLTWRPANDAVAAVNPPRFSWPAVPRVVSQPGQPLIPDFRFQLSRQPDFAKPEFNIATPYNFFNALPVLAPGTWHWRVGHQIDAKLVWSAARRFQLHDQSVAWDRTIITRAAKILGAQPHPRLGPAAGDWARLRKQLEADPETRGWLEEVAKRARTITRKPWWTAFPRSDAKGETELNERGFTDIAADLAVAALASKLTGDPALATVKAHLLAFAKFPPGGFSAPEYNGAGGSKWPTQIIEFLAVGYDWLHTDLTASERDLLRRAVEWRLHAVYFVRDTWRNGPVLSTESIAGYCRSHPYENFMWSLPAVLLLAGDLPLADELVPLGLHYLTGVTIGQGPDEGWNEGLMYGTTKGEAMINASTHAALLLPDLQLGRNPVYARLGEWYAHLLPVGVERLPFGDYGARAPGALTTQRNVFRRLSWLTGDGACETRRRALVALHGNGLSTRPWLDLLSAGHFAYPEPKPESTRAVFPDAGWVMTSTRTPSDRKGFDEALGMIFQCRPRGGHSHSYRAENDFAWHAYGQTLTAGGGSTVFSDPHARDSLSHNVMLIDGVGQEWNHRAPNHPWCGRLLAYREKKDDVHWVGDATHAYQTLPQLARWHRHVVFVAGRCFVLLDDLAVRPGAAPAKFSWLYHVAPKVDLALDPDGAGFRYRMKDVHARVLFGNPASDLDLRNLEGRAGFTNPLTGQDLYPPTVKALGTGERRLRDDQIMAHNVWVTNRQPAREWTLLTVLHARRDGEPEPRTSFLAQHAVRIEWPDGTSRTVSFDPRQRGDIQIDLERIRQHGAAEARPSHSASL